MICSQNTALEALAAPQLFAIKQDRLKGAFPF
jgi:hypothetical protein